LRNDIEFFLVQDMFNYSLAPFRFVAAANMGTQSYNKTLKSLTTVTGA